MDRILIIEDEPDVADVISEVLELHGYVTDATMDGEKGIELAKQTKPALVLCDINLPGINGYEILENLRNDDRTKALPFIFLTAQDSMKDLRRGMQHGADDYLVKPVDAQDLIAAIRTRLARSNELSVSSNIEKSMSDGLFARQYNLPSRQALEDELEVMAGYDSAGALLVLVFPHLQHMVDVVSNEQRAEFLNKIIQIMADSGQNRMDVFLLERNRLALLLHDKTDRVLLTQTAQKLIDALRKPLMWLDNQIHLTINIGVAYTGSHATSLENLLTHSELAANRALENGYSSFVFYKPVYSKRAVDRLRLESALHSAVSRGEFFLHYQPKQSLANNQTVGMEALIRWNHKEYGMMSPVIFISLAEETGLIVSLGDWLLEEVCSQVKNWQQAGLTVPPVAVNISGLQLAEPDFIEKVKSTLHKKDISPSNLEFELTESVLVRNQESTAKILSELRQLGIQISIDDFGTGYSSFAYLRDLPFDKIKIDQAFIRNIPGDSHMSAITVSMIDMAHQLGAKVVAEGVENTDQLKLLNEHNCDEIQGFYFSKPLPASKMKDILAE